MVQQALFEDKPVRQVSVLRAHNPLALPLPPLRFVADHVAWLELNPCMDAGCWLPRGSTYSLDCPDATFVCGHDWAR